jgi:2-polyprenyl-3-methyl-5-hydroxy-6-metoxy-1,4-benzoquinol methylase
MSRWRTLLQRLNKNLRRELTRPLRARNARDEAFREEELIDLGEFTGLPQATVLEYLRRDRGRRISDEHGWVRPRDAREYGWFYRGSRVYLFTAGAEPWARALEHAGAGKRVLDFGGGGGRNSIAMARKGAQVFYVDPSVMNAAFVAFRAKKHRLDITVIDPLIERDGAWRIDTADAVLGVGNFDLVIADNVLEHVVDYHLTVEKLAKALAPGGRLLECTPFKREKAYLFGGPAPWDVHLPPSMPMVEAARRAGLVPAGSGLWERPERSAG